LPGADAGSIGIMIGILICGWMACYCRILAWFIRLILWPDYLLTDLTRGALGLNVDYISKRMAKPYFYVIFVICGYSFIVLRWVNSVQFGIGFYGHWAGCGSRENIRCDPMKYKVINFYISVYRRLCGAFMPFYRFLTPDVWQLRAIRLRYWLSPKSGEEEASVARCKQHF
jgi:hypothetical protein